MDLEYDFFICRKARFASKGSLDIEGLAVDELRISSLKNFDFDAVLLVRVKEETDRDFEFSLSLRNEDSKHMTTESGCFKIKHDPNRTLSFKAGVSPDGEVTRDSFCSTETFSNIIEFRGLSLPRSMVLCLNVFVKGRIFYEQFFRVVESSSTSKPPVELT